ncbi:MAG: M28 family peptidase [Armatimonas sp.]
MHFRVLAAASLTLGALISGPAFAQKPSTGAKKASEIITAAGLKDYLSFIASDALMGRDTPSPGLDTAAQFIGFFLKRWGFLPGGGDGTYFQKIPLTRTSYDLSKSNISVGGAALTPSKDFALSAGSGFGSTTGAAMLLRVSTALPTDTDLTGKILVVLGQRREFDAMAYAKKNGATGLVRLAQGAQAQWEQFAGFRQRGGYRVGTGETPAGLPSIDLSPDAGTALLEGQPTAMDVPQPMTKTVSFTVEGRVENINTQNVVAIWPGSDAKLKDEYVAMGAHYDHVGANPNMPGDNIFNGADDDGSGTTALIGICEALARGRVKTKRSLIIVWHCGEEKGLWGSEYFTNKPTVPIDKITAQLNIDMIGRSKPAGDEDPRDATLSGPEQIYVIGSRMLSTDLGNIVDGVNASTYKLTYDTRYDDPKDPNRFYYRSDHYNYARKGIPITFWFDGVHVDYHRPGDEVSKIDFIKMEKITRTVFLTAATLADLPNRPKVDKPVQ